jgi:hypothetical protein
VSGYSALGSRGLLLVWEEDDCWGAVDCYLFGRRVTVGEPWTVTCLGGG